MPVISGRDSFPSSKSTHLQSSLENKLRARLDVNGSLEYAMRWKHWDLGSGPLICALRASARRTSDNGCSGWPTPQAGSHATERYNEAGNTDSSRRMVALVTGHVAPSEAKRYKLAGWQTPKTPTGGGTEKRRTPGGGQRKLEDQVYGIATTSSHVQTPASGALNPEHPRWLMGFPAGWANYVGMETRSSRKSRRSS